MAVLQLERQFGPVKESVQMELHDKLPNYLVERRKNLYMFPEVPDDRLCVVVRTRRSGWVIVDYSGHDTYVDGIRVAECKQLYAGNRIQFMKIGRGEFEIEAVLYDITEHEIKSGDVLLQPDASGEVPTCKLCYAPFSVGEVVVICPDCKNATHKQCWKDENDDTCPNCGYHASDSEIKLRK